MRIQIFSLLTVSWLALTFTFAPEGTTKKAAVQETLVIPNRIFFSNPDVRDRHIHPPTLAIDAELIARVITGAPIRRRGD